MLIAALLIAAAAAAALAVSLRQPGARPGAVDELKREVCVVHTRGGGPSIRGAVVAVHSDALVLERAVHLDVERELPGQVVVPRSQIVWIQRGELDGED